MKLPDFSFYGHLAKACDRVFRDDDFAELPGPSSSAPQSSVGTTAPRFQRWIPTALARGATHQTFNWFKLDAAISTPTDLILFCDSYNPWQDCSSGCQAGCPDGCHSFIWDRIGRGFYQGNQAMPTDWHSSGIDLAFADGHVKWRPLGAILYSNWVLDLPTTDPHYSMPITHDW